MNLLIYHTRYLAKDDLSYILETCGHNVALVSLEECNPGVARTDLADYRWGIVIASADLFVGVNPLLEVVKKIINTNKPNLQSMLLIPVSQYAQVKDLNPFGVKEVSGMVERPDYYLALLQLIRDLP